MTDLSRKIIDWLFEDSEMSVEDFEENYEGLLDTDEDVMRALEVACNDDSDMVAEVIEMCQ